VEDLDGEVLADLSEHVLVLLLEDRAGTVVGVDDALADLEHEQLGWLEILEQGLEITLVGNLELTLVRALEVRLRCRVEVVGRFR
jgi:hypothetical protein